MPPSWCLIINCRNWISASDAARVAQAPKFSVARHTVHQRHAICCRRHLGVARHPRHPWPRRGLRQSPLLQPSHEDAALRALSHDDVGRERSKLVIGGRVAHDERHVHGLRVVGCHVPGESGLGRIVAWRAEPRSDQQPRGDRQDDDEQAGGDQRQPTRDIGHRRRHDVLYYALRYTATEAQRWLRTRAG